MARELREEKYTSSEITWEFKKCLMDQIVKSSDVCNWPAVQRQCRWNRVIKCSGVSCVKKLSSANMFLGISVNYANPHKAWKHFCLSVSKRRKHVWKCNLIQQYRRKPCLEWPGGNTQRWPSLRLFTLLIGHLTRPIFAWFRQPKLPKGEVLDCRLSFDFKGSSDLGRKNTWAY